MKIGILQTGYASDAMKATEGDYPDMFARLLAGHGFSFETFEVVDGRFPASIQDADGWLVTGSRHGAYEPHDWIPPLEELIREVYRAKQPMIGVCFGHQIIAQALGGRVEKFKDGWGVGRKTYVGPDGEEIALLAWHQDQVIELGPDAKLVAGDEFCKYAVLSYGETVFTTQPHPEFGPQAIKHLINSHGEKVLAERLSQAERNRTLPVDAQKTADRFAAFFKRNLKEQAA
ncbi:MAG: type 1 glutamine amidotransferase [Pseudomonadota bacterium]